MARSRNIKPGFFLNDELAECDPLARLLFAGLWCIADREGRLEDRPKRIKAEVLPYDDCDVDQLLDQLAERGFIIRYEVDGSRYIQVTNFSKHQNPHKNEKDSEIPAPDMYHTSTVQVPDEHRTMPDKDNVRGEGQEIANAEKPNNHGCLTEYSTSTVQVPEKHSTNPADSFNMIPDSFNMIPDSFNMIPGSKSSCPESSLPDDDQPQPEQQKSQEKKYKYSEEHMQLAELLKNQILANKPDARLPANLEPWANTFRLMMERDRREPSRIAEVIIWCQNNEFWRTNILSADKLRQKFDQLELQMQRSPRAGPRVHIPRGFASLMQMREEIEENARKRGAQFGRNSPG